MEFLTKIPTELAYVAVAVIGGIARYLQNYLNNGDFTMRHFCAHVFVSAFSGYMFYQFTIEVLHLPPSISPIVAGLGGWLGVEAMKMIEVSIRKKINK